MSRRFAVNYTLILSQSNAILSKPPHYVFSEDVASLLVSKNIETKTKKMKIIDSRATDIRLVDGSKMSISLDSSSRHIAQAKSISKEDIQTQIRKYRCIERIFTIVANIMARKDYGLSALRNPVWRISRVVPNSDQRSYILYWLIDDINDCMKYKVPYGKIDYLLLELD